MNIISSEPLNIGQVSMHVHIHENVAQCQTTH